MIPAFEYYAPRRAAQIGGCPYSGADSGLFVTQPSTAIAAASCAPARAGVGKRRPMATLFGIREGHCVAVRIHFTANRKPYVACRTVNETGRLECICRVEEDRATNPVDASKTRMNAANQIPSGIVTVNIDGVRYRGRYTLRNDDFVVTAHGLACSRIDADVLSDGDDRVVMNLAKLMLTDMVSEALGSDDTDLTLALQGSTTRPCYV